MDCIGNCYRLPLMVGNVIDMTDLICPQCHSKQGYKTKRPDSFRLWFFCSYCGFSCLMKVYRSKFRAVDKYNLTDLLK